MGGKESLNADVETAITLDEQARALVSAYFFYHSENGNEVCPCEVCAAARVYFAAVLRNVDHGWLWRSRDRQGSKDND